MYSPSRRTSIASHANSTFSQAGSTRHMLADMHSGPLDPPMAPFSGPSASQYSLRGGSPVTNTSSNVSLTVNYVPSKFSAPGARKRKGEPAIPKRGGGVEAFRSGESRMPGQNDDDYDGVSSGWFMGKEGGRTPPRKLRWTKFKWILFVANSLVRPHGV